MAPAANIASRFQSSLPRGSDLPLPVPPQRCKTFQSSLPRGSDAVVLGFTATPQRIFQSSLPRGSDSASLPMGNGRYAISILAPSRERRYLIFCLIVIYLISILAPSRERPATIDTKRLAARISILAPSRERRVFFVCRFRHIADFNPRSLAGATVPGWTAD